MKKIVLTFLGVFLFSSSLTLFAGWNSKSLRNLDVAVEYFGFNYRNSSGEPVYSMDRTVQYRITIYNNGKRPYRNFPVKATLYWAGAVTCVRYWLDNKTASFGPLLALPDRSQSGPHYLNIASHSYSFFDGFYDIPDTVCPNKARILIDAGRGNSSHDSLVVPLNFEIIR